MTAANMLVTFDLDEEDLTATHGMAMSRHVFDLASIHQSEHEFQPGSVLAIVQFPSDPGADCNGYAFKSVYKIRMDHHRLVATGSTKILAMLDPGTQARIRRRHNLQQLPEGIDYVIDLTPPTEGHETASLIASLCLPQSTKLWHLAGHYVPDPSLKTGLDAPGTLQRPLADNPVAAVLALGHDDKCSCRRYHDNDFASLWEPNNAPGIYHGPHVPAFRQVDDYCGTRHCVNIIRLLRAINGADLLINSATRMWTIVQVAIDLEVTSIIRDSVAQWFLAPPNTKFMEIFPEESFRVALVLQIPDILITSFKVLVSEFAMDHAAATVRPLQHSPLTWAQRRRGEYGDMPLDPVEHAGIALYERIKDKFDKLDTDTALDDLGVPEWERLKSLGPLIRGAQATDGPVSTQNLLVVYQKLVACVVDCFQGHVKDALQPSPQPGSHLGRLIKSQRLHYIPQHALTDMEQLQMNLNKYQKALCPFFWQNLRSDFYACKYKFYRGTSLRRLSPEFNNLLGAAVSAGDLPLDGTIFAKNIVPPYSPHFNLDALIDEVDQKLCRLSGRVLRPEADAPGVPMLISDHIISKLDENELKYLPIWAGGCDDGSGGAFQDAVPFAEMGPSEPGPGYHTGWTAVATDTDAVRTASMSDTGTYGNLGPGGMLRSSLAAQGSASTATLPGRGTPGSLASEQFVTDRREFDDAMRVEPAEHQPFAQTLVAYVEWHGDDAETKMEVEDEDSDDTLSLGSAGDDLSDFELV